MNDRYIYFANLDVIANGAQFWFQWARQWALRKSELKWELMHTTWQNRNAFTFLTFIYNIRKYSGDECLASMKMDFYLRLREIRTWYACHIIEPLFEKKKNCFNAYKKDTRNFREGRICTNITPLRESLLRHAASKKTPLCEAWHVTYVVSWRNAKVFPLMKLFFLSPQIPIIQSPFFLHSSH